MLLDGHSLVRSAKLLVTGLASLTKYIVSGEIWDNMLEIENLPN